VNDGVLHKEVGQSLKLKAEGSKLKAQSLEKYKSSDY